MHICVMFDVFNANILGVAGINVTTGGQKGLPNKENLACQCKSFILFCSMYIKLSILSKLPICTSFLLLCGCCFYVLKYNVYGSFSDLLQVSDCLTAADIGLQ